MAIGKRRSAAEALKDKESRRYSPKRVCISMKQGNAPLAKAVVKVGQYVSCGELIGRSCHDDFHIYASISGRIEKIYKERISVTENAERVVIAQTEENVFAPEHGWEITRENLKQLGIVAALGKKESFFNYCEQVSQKNTLNLLAFDREPGDYADNSLIMECASKIILGAKCLAEIYNIHQLNIYITSEEVSHILKKQIQRFLKTLSPLITFHIYAINGNPYEQHFYLTKKDGIWCTPTELCLVYDGFYDFIPSITRRLTVSGIVKYSGIYEVPNGTLIKDLLTHCGMKDEKGTWVVTGGIMRGHCVSLEDTAVDLTMQSLCVIPEKGCKELPCIGCGRCKKVCPLGLNPMNIKDNSSLDIKKCVECGLCSYVCPSHRSLKEQMMAAKKQGGIKKESIYGNYIDIDADVAKQLEPLVQVSQSGPYIHSPLDLQKVINYAVLSTALIVCVCTWFLSPLYLLGALLGTVLFYGLSCFFKKNSALLWKISFLTAAIAVVTIGTVTGGFWWVTLGLWGNIIACILKVYIL